MKIKIRSRKWSHKRDGIGVRIIRTFPFLPTPLTTPSLRFRLWSSENQIVGVASRNGRINQSQCTFPRFVICLVLLLLLPTPTIWFSLDHKRNVSDGVVSGIGTLFSLDHKLYASDYGSDADSVASENQPLHENMSAGVRKRGRAKALAPPFLSPVSSHFPVRAFSILGTRLSRSLEQSKGVTE